ncbi:hypothetical protein [Microvirga sp. TS319]|uniref:hypothetical protein n=1 Tax=Microvirga sp. TS319 TaxID=3241165 RepID=UPI00351A45DF
MRKVRFVKDFDFRPRASIVMVNKAGEEKTVTEAIYAAASAAGAVELLDGKDEEPGTAAAEAGSAPAKSKGRNQARG